MASMFDKPLPRVFREGGDGAQPAEDVIRRIVSFDAHTHTHAHAYTHAHTAPTQAAPAPAFRSCLTGLHTAARSTQVQPGVG